MSVITEYIDKQLGTENIEKISRIYQIVHNEIDDTEDSWKYGIPTFLYKGLPIIGFAVTKKGVSIYPYGNATITPFLEKEIAPYVTGGGTLSFKSGVEIPDALVVRITQVRKAYIEEKLKK